MAIESTTAPPAEEPLRAALVYAVAGISLCAGLAIGYFAGPWSLPSPVPPIGKTIQVATSATGLGSRKGAIHSQGLDQMKQAADKQAAPLLDKLKSNPGDSALLTQVGTIYHGNHQFKEAAAYFDKAVQADPTNVALRTKLASSLFRNGDTDGAIAQLNKALTYDPKDANSLFNLGMIKLQGKADGKGAVAAWQRLLKSNPQLSADRRAEVQKLMADVLTTLGDGRGPEGARKQ